MKSVSTPVRVFALGAIADGAVNAKQVHEAWHKQDLTMSLSNVSYHLRSLREAGLIRVVAERQVRGAIQKDYGLTRKGREVLAIVNRL